MYRALIGRISRFPPFSLIVNATSTLRPFVVLPIARDRLSRCEWSSSGTMSTARVNRSSISRIETPCFWHFARFPLSQSNPAIGSSGTSGQVHSDVPDEAAGYEPLVTWIGGERERPESDRAQQRRASRRPGHKGRRSLPTVEADAHFSKLVHNGLAAREDPLEVFLGLESQPLDDFCGKQRIERPRIDEERRRDRPLAMLGMDQRDQDRKRAHALMRHTFGMRTSFRLTGSATRPKWASVTIPNRASDPRGPARN